MAATVTFLNRKGVRLNDAGMKELLNSSEVRTYVTNIAQDVLHEAIAHAPVKTGAYRDGLHIEQDTTDRVVVRVKGNTDHDWYVEAETGNLSRAMDAAGVTR